MRKRGPRKLKRPHVRGELRAVVDETIALYLRMKWVSDQIYEEEGRGGARRGVLRGLVRYGAQTVPAMARARGVSRQHVQEVVDAMREDGLVELLPNPRHRRSHLIAATPRGEALVGRMDDTDDRVLAGACGALATRDLEITARTLRAMREGFELGTRWRRAL
jgi:DNA-binding MarR family transcriptional regulator